MLHHGILLIFFHRSVPLSDLINTIFVEHVSTGEGFASEILKDLSRSRHACIVKCRFDSKTASVFILCLQELLSGKILLFLTSVENHSRVTGQRCLIHIVLISAVYFFLSLLVYHRRQCSPILISLKLECNLLPANYLRYHYH